MAEKMMGMGGMAPGAGPGMGAEPAAPAGGLESILITPTPEGGYSLEITRGGQTETKVAADIAALHTEIDAAIGQETPAEAAPGKGGNALADFLSRGPGAGKPGMA
jgi:hypothetical protein